MAWRRLQRWKANGTWEQLWGALLAALDEQEKLAWAKAFLDGPSRHKGGRGR